MDKESTMDYINQMFPTEASLTGVEPLMQKVHNEIRRVDAEILLAVRQQVSVAFVSISFGCWFTLYYDCNNQNLLMGLLIGFQM
ncbi:hypothetical protein Leryth_022084 [Lithospermum erythrorhizon]|nr:hypothetical protein Leryth_022084 [Lithospermum erythrorhizon]